MLSYKLIKLFLLSSLLNISLFAYPQISQDIKGLDSEEIKKIQEIQIEMDKKSEEFLKNDSEIYLKEGA